MANPAQQPVPVKPSVEAVAAPLFSRRMQMALAFVLGALALLLCQRLVHGWVYQGRPVLAVERTASGERLASLVLDLNTAPESDIRCVPGIGPVLGARIVAHRERCGPFSSVDDLERVHGIGPGLAATVRPYFYVARATATATPGPLKDLDRPVKTSGKREPVVPLNLNQASREELQTLPGIGPTLAERIVADRSSRGPFRTVADLTRVRGIKGKTLEKVRPHLRVDEAVVRKDDGVGS